MIPEYRINQQRKSGKKILLLALFLIIGLLVGFYIYAYVKINKPNSSESGSVTLSVPKGATTKDVGEELAEKNLIGGPYLFVAYSLFVGANGKIQAGDYLLDRKMSMAEILDTLTGGKVTRNTKRATFVEGWTNAQYSKHLQDLGLVTKNTFDSAVDAEYEFAFSDAGKDFEYQGFLFPDTYQFDANLSAENIIFKMLQNFENRFTDQMKQDMERKNLDIKDVIILASIIEREVGRNSSVSVTDEVRTQMQNERELVASVFYNRLEIDMPLQSDATVNYATGKSDRRAQFEDLKISSPYNTYVVVGLPPGPISNPGIDSIRAAIYPAQSDYLYFLNNQRGEAFFARTIQEHNSNRAKYLD
jgi:UPF0755 protein